MNSNRIMWIFTEWVEVMLNQCDQSVLLMFWWRIRILKLRIFQTFETSQTWNVQSFLCPSSSHAVQAFEVFKLFKLSNSHTSDMFIVWDCPNLQKLKHSNVSSFKHFDIFKKTTYNYWWTKCNRIDWQESCNYKLCIHKIFL